MAERKDIHKQNQGDDMQAGSKERNVSGGEQSERQGGQFSGESRQGMQSGSNVGRQDQPKSGQGQPKGGQSGGNLGSKQGSQFGMKNKTGESEEDEES